LDLVDDRVDGILIRQGRVFLGKVGFIEQIAAALQVQTEGDAVAPEPLTVRRQEHPETETE